MASRPLVLSRRDWLRRVAAASVCTMGGCARSRRDERWPSQPVRVVVPFGPGSSADLAARLFAALLAERWEQAVVIDNRPGGDGVAGVQAYVTARDHHALLFAPTGIVTSNPILHARMPFALREIVPIAGAVRPSIGIAAATTMQMRSLGELAAQARQRPGAWLWATAPGLPELVFRAFLTIEQLDMRHVAYGDIAPAVRDLDAGRIHLMVAGVPTLTPVLTAGNARLLAVTTSHRNAAWPDVPTVRDAGYPALTADGPFGFFGWRGLSEALRHRIASDVRQVASADALSSRLATVGFAVDVGTPEDFTEAIQAQRRQVETLARLAGLPVTGVESR